MIINKEKGLGEKLLKDKRGFVIPVGIFIFVVVGLALVVGIAQGALAGNLINNIFQSPILVIGLILLFLFVITGRKK